MNTVMFYLLCVWCVVFDTKRNENRRTFIFLFEHSPQHPHQFVLLMDLGMNY